MKKGVKAITGKKHVKVGDWENYNVAQWHENTPVEKRNGTFIKWELYHLESGKNPIKVLEKELGHFRFQSKAVGEKFLVSAHVYEPDLASSSTMEITVIDTQEPKILGIDITDVNDKPVTKKLAYGQNINVHIRTVGMVGHHLNISLWEDDVDGAGHSNKNTKVLKFDKPVRVGSKGIAHTQFMLSPNFARMAAANSRNEGTTHEYYITVYALGELKASKNINLVYPEQRLKETKEKLEGKSKPKEIIPPVKKKVKVQPAGATPKPTTLDSRTPAEVYRDDQKKRITKVTLTKTNASQLIATIYSTNIINKDIIFKLYEDDYASDDLLIDQTFTISGDTMPIYVDLKKVSQSKGGTFWEEGSEQELYVDIEVLETNDHYKSTTVNVDSAAMRVMEVDKSNKKVVVEDGKAPKEKFDKVKVKAEEAVLYISSEIATAIVVDKDGDIVSYPDYGAYNGQDEYIEDGKIYCKEIKIGGKKKSAFPTYKMYIYRGNTKGEAVKKLKQDLKLKTHENAESTVLEIARHSKNNLNYKQSGSIPPNNIDKLYRLKYQEGSSHKKTSYRYRIVDDNAGNFPIVKDYKKEYDKGGMNLGSRSAISIDPWKSSGLEGCIGIRDAGGGDNPNCKDAMKKQDAANYKYIYHSLNNYLEGLIPEMTGIFGRRGFSSTGGTVNAEASTYDHEIKVYVLANHLPDIDECGLFADNRRLYYKSFGSKTVKYMEKNSTANKFKGLYMIAQRRQENGFRLKTIGNNPMNIKGSGDAGQIAMNTHETINGKYISVPGEKFANFTTENSGIKGYIDLLNKNFNDAYKSLFDDAKTIDDFTAGLEDTGKKGAYATGQAQGKLSATDAYKAALKSNFNTTKKDYIKIYECLITKSTDSKIKSQLEADLELLKKLE